MRKLGILLAVMVAATLGFVGIYTGTAEASQCSDATGGGDEQLSGVADTFEGGGDPGVFSSVIRGAADACANDSVIPLLCGPADSIDALAGAGGQDASPLTSEIRGGLDELGANLPAAGGECGGGSTDCKDTNTCPGDDDDDDDDDDTQSQVKAQNAAADGTLPRTGGELFAGAGLGLMSLGALVRRFLP